MAAEDQGGQQRLQRQSQEQLPHLGSRDADPTLQAVAYNDPHTLTLTYLPHPSCDLDPHPIYYPTLTLTYPNPNPNPNPVRPAYAAPFYAVNLSELVRRTEVRNEPSK